MLGLPQVGQKVHVWPAPGRRVQDGARPVDEGGRFLPAEGNDVIWSEYHHDQMRSGDLFLHDPSHRGCSNCGTSHDPDGECAAPHVLKERIPEYAPVAPPEPPPAAPPAAAEPEKE
jgi:hypothetical protein